MYIGVFRRLISLFLDIIVFLGFYLPLLFLIQILISIPYEKSLVNEISILFSKPYNINFQQDGSQLLIYFCLWVFFWFVLETFFVNSSFSGTPGKVVLGLEIVCYNNASLFKSIIRSFLKVLSIMTVVCMIFESIKLSLNKNKQSLHDLAASTLVKRKEIKTVMESRNIEMIFNNLESGKLNSFEDIMELKSKIADNKLSTKQNSGLAISWILIAIGAIVLAAVIILSLKGIQL